MKILLKTHCLVFFKKTYVQILQKMEYLYTHELIRIINFQFSEYPTNSLVTEIWCNFGYDNLNMDTVCLIK